MSKAYVNGVECIIYGFYEGADINALVYYPETNDNARHLVPMSMVEVESDSEV